MRILILTLLACAALAAGCGSGGGDTGEPNGPSVGAERSSGSVQSETIAVADADRVLEAEDSINTRCGLVKDQEGSDMPLPRRSRSWATSTARTPRASSTRASPPRRATWRRSSRTTSAGCASAAPTAEADRLAGVLKS
jgi:hypothetical protein